VLILVPGETRRGDFRLLDDLSKGLELLDVAVVKDPRAEMTQAGIELDLPAGATLFANPTPQSPRLLLGGGEDQDCWWLKISRVPLVGGRTPEALVRDFVCTEFESNEPPQPIETREVNGRTLAAAEVPIRPDAEP